MILTSAPAMEATTSDDKHEQSPASTQTGRGRTGTMRRIIVILFLLALGVSTSRAQSSVSITTSPLHITESIFQATGELKLIDVVSVAGTAGIGSRDGELVTLGGGQIRFYLMGGFDGGLHIGAEALYTELGRSSSIEGIVNLMNGTSVSPLLGYKYIFPFGLTVDLQGGLRFGENGIERSDEDLSPLANVNVGWSF